MPTTFLSPAKGEHFASFFFRQMIISGYPWHRSSTDKLFNTKKGIIRHYCESYSNFDIPSICAVSANNLRSDHSLRPLIILDIIVKFGIAERDRKLIRQKEYSIKEYSEREPCKSTEKIKMTQKLQHLKFCSMCMMESLKSNGFIYYKSIWLYDDVTACHIHKTRLSNTAMLGCGCNINYKVRFASLIHGYCLKCHSRIFHKSTRATPNEIRHSLLIKSFLKFAKTHLLSNNTFTLKKPEYLDIVINDKYNVSVFKPTYFPKLDFHSFFQSSPETTIQDNNCSISSTVSA